MKLRIAILFIFGLVLGFLLEPLQLYSRGLATALMTAYLFGGVWYLSHALSQYFLRRISNGRN